MHKTLITGASGFVGTNLISSFESGDLFEVETLKLRADWDGSINDDVDAVIHLAGKAHDLKNASDSQEYYQVNYELTKLIYDAFLKSNARSFIFMSSVKAVTDLPEGVLTEEVVPAPKTDYGKSKQMAEKYVEANKSPGKAYYILRPCMIHGPGNKGNLNLLYRFVSKGIPYPLGAFQNQRSFLSIDNLAFVIEELLHGKTTVGSGIYNVSDDAPLSTNRVIELTAQANARQARIMKVPQWIIKAMTGLGDALRLPLNSHNLKKLTEDFVVSNKKITRALSKQLPVSAEDGILKTLRSFES